MNRNDEKVNGSERYLSDLTPLAARPDHERVHRSLDPLLLALHETWHTNNVCFESADGVLVQHSEALVI